jgi:hypothetical protein
MHVDLLAYPTTTGWLISLAVRTSLANAHGNGTGGPSNKGCNITLHTSLAAVLT